MGQSAPVTNRAAERRDDWDPTGPAAQADPLGVQADLREHCPVAWTNRIGDGFWAITRWSDVIAAAKDTTTFSNAGNLRFGKTPSPPIEVDRPEHTAWRRLIAPYFTRQRMAELEPTARELTVALLEPLLRSGGGDFAEAVSYPLPAQMLCALLGIPVADAGRIKRWSEQVFMAMQERDDDPVALARAEAELQAYGQQLVADRLDLALNPATDLVTGLITQEVQGRRLTSTEIVAMIRLLLSAGHNSTTSSLGISMLRVAEDAGRQGRLRADPSLIPAAINEFLRHESPVMATKRLATRDTELHGRRIGAGDAVFLVWSAANRDERHYDGGDRCRIDRDAADHVAFGHGIHRCVGLPLALMEIRIMLEEVLARTATIGLAGPVLRSNWERHGVTQLPLTFETTEPTS